MFNVCFRITADLMSSATTDDRERLTPSGPEGSRSTSVRSWLALFAENFMHEISDVPGTELFQEIGAMEIDGAGTDA